jgi:cellulose synthase/poly-beta-1,6-N-acetylglucosamine synthase-like glycosyltransferase
MEVLDELFIVITEYLSYIRGQYMHRSFWMWVLFFFPFVVFLEIPRYLAPLIIYPLAKLFGFASDDLEKKKKFLQTNPEISIVIAARNEEEVIGATLSSLVDIEYEHLEIILVDDHSTDSTYEIGKRFEQRDDRVSVYRNRSAAGRGGRPFASNYGFQMATGEIIISVDADTTFDRNMLLHAVGPFYDPEVGVVTGNLKARNRGENYIVDLQACEYLMSIGFWKKWTDLFDVTLHASGAFSVFRRSVLEDVGGWDPELAEDADISVKAHKLGWNIRFAPRAIAMTTVPNTWSGLIGQRIRWDRGFLRTYYHKHGDVLRFWRFKLGTAFELVVEYLMQVVMTLVFPLYLVLMLVYLPLLLTFVILTTYFFYCAQTFLTLLFSIVSSERASSEWTLLQYTFLFPVYQMVMRWVRTYAIVLEMFRWQYRDTYLPDSVYDNTEKW